MINNVKKRALLILLSMALLGNSLQMPGVALRVSAHESDSSDSGTTVSSNEIILSENVESTDTEIVPDEKLEQGTGEPLENLLSVPGNEAQLQEPLPAESIEVIDKGSVILHINQEYLSGEPANLEENQEDYDQPVVLTEDVQIQLSVEWSEPVTYEGTLTWSILCAEMGTEAGTTNLVGEDDWSEFEEVEESPYFVAEIEENEEYSVCNITANKVEEADNYDYYIRAEFCYIENQSEKVVTTTIPVLVEYAIDVEGKTSDEDVIEEQPLGELSVSENSVQDNTVSEHMVPEDILENEISAEEEDFLLSPDVEPDQNLVANQELSEVTGALLEESEGPFYDVQNGIEITDEIWVDGFERESDSLRYTGDKVTQNLRVYHKETLLKEGTDYTLTYKNNVDVADYDSVGAPSVRIAMKGQYSGSRTLYFTIKPRDIGQDCSYDTEQILYYQKRLSFSVPVILMESKKLTYNRDYVCDYSGLPEDYRYGDSYEEGQIYQYTVNGKGNFTGSFTVNLMVINDKSRDFKNAVVTLDKKQYEYHGVSLTTADVSVLSVKTTKGEVLPELYTYEVHGDSVGTGYVEVYPSVEGKNAGYLGVKKIEIDVVADRDIRDAGVGSNWLDTIVFSGKKLETAGGFYQGTEGVLVYTDGENQDVLRENEDYTVEYKNNNRVGQATVIFTGIGRYKGTLKKTYDIVKNEDLTIVWADVDDTGAPIAPYTKGGVVPKFALIESYGNKDAYTLQYKTDYIYKLTNNYDIGIMTCKIIGRGNYSGFECTHEVEIVHGNLADGSMLVYDREYSEQPDEWKAPVSLMDEAGNRLRADKDYNRELIYSYDGMEEGTLPQIGTIVSVTAFGINNYDGSSITGSYRICGVNINSLIIEIDSQEYTGREIELTAEDIHVYTNCVNYIVGNEMENAEEICYVIEGYENNINAGTAKVTLRGIGDYGGSRTYSFRITRKLFLTTHVTEVLLDAASITLGVGNQRQLIASILPAAADNKTILWKSTDTNVARVDKNGVITAINPGTATIKAVSQDTGKTAECKVEVQVIPVVSFSLNQTEISQNEGTQCQLSVINVEPVEATYDTIQWESTNIEIASVDENGLVSLNKAGMTVIKAYVEETGAVQKCMVFVNSDEKIELEVEYYTPQMFRTSDDKDDTASFNAAIDAVNGTVNTVYVPAGTYWIDAEESVRPRSNMNLIMSPNALLKAIPNSEDSYKIINVESKKNVNISGGRIAGERKEHGSTKGEWGHGIGVYDSININISNVDVSDCWGDGIYLGSRHEDEEGAGCNQITITGCDLHNNRRNNLAIVCADNVKVDNCKFREAHGTAPEYGIDIEPNNTSNPSENIVISNCAFTDNLGGSMGIVTNANDITLDKCTMNGMFVNYAGTNVTLSNTTVNGEMDARIGVAMVNGSTINDGSSKEDILIASFQADKGSYNLEKYGIDTANQMTASIISDGSSSDGHVLSLERLTKGNRESGYYVSVSEFDGDILALKAGVTYRYEYVVKGSGLWGFKTTQTGWYPISPMENEYRTCYNTYKADKGSACKVLFYAIEKEAGMHLEVDSVKIYEVR